MSLIKDIGDELAAMVTQIESAQNTATEAEEAAGDIEERAAAAGFIGIADGMSQVRDAVQEIRARLSSAGDELGQAHAPVDSAPKQTTPEDAIDALSPATQHLDGVYESVAAAIDQADEAARLVSAALDGGEPGPMLSRLNSIKDELEQVVSRCDAAKRHVATAVADVQQTGAIAG